MPSGESLQFPNNVSVIVELLPGTSFGTDGSPSRTIVRAREAKAIVDAIHGRLMCKSDPPLERLEAISDGSERRIALEGNILTYDFLCSSASELEQSICAVVLVLPTVLNLGFPDPPVIEVVKGTVGDTEFRWEYLPDECQTTLHTVTKEQLEAFAMGVTRIPQAEGSGFLCP